MAGELIKIHVTYDGQNPAGEWLWAVRISPTTAKVDNIPFFTTAFTLGHTIVLGWGWEGEDDLPPDTSRVTITIDPTETGSSVTLTHEGLPTPERVAAHAEGWQHPETRSGVSHRNGRASEARSLRSHLRHHDEPGSTLCLR